MKNLLPIICSFAILPACASNQISADLPRGASAYSVIPSPSPTRVADDYRIVPFDGLDITVFDEPELSPKAVPVDAHGNVNLPLIGDVMAAGKTANQLAQEIEAKYTVKYLRSPHASVVVSSPVPQKVTVQGEVVQPGIYDIKGPTTLLGALSLAKGETEIASLDQVVVFRTVGGRRMGAVFDVKAIRAGEAEDPQILSNDMVVVGYSAAKRMWNNIVSALPLTRIFRPF